jgi:hypothetical protein
MWISVVYSKGELDIFHRKVCLMGQCPDCGVENLQLCPNEIETERYVQLWCIRYVVVGKNNNGQDKRVSRVEYKDTSFSEQNPKHHVVWSNGCAGQFKNVWSWYTKRK